MNRLHLPLLVIILLSLLLSGPLFAQSIDDLPLPEPPPPEECDELPPPPPDSRYIYRLMEHMQNENPAEYERMGKLRKDDPVAFHCELREMLMARRAQHFSQQNENLTSYFSTLPPEEQEHVLKELMGVQRRHGKHRPRHDKRDVRMMKQIKSLLNQYTSAETDENRAALKTEIMELLGKEFDRRSTERQQDVDRMQQQVEALQKKLNTRTTHRDAIINRRFNELTQDDALKW